MLLVGLKISNQTEQLFYDIAWIAGVDYDKEAFEGAQDEDDQDDQASDTEGNDELPGEDFDEMDPDEVQEAEDLIKLGDEMVEEEEPPNETDKQEVNPSTDYDIEPNVRMTSSGRISRRPTKRTMVHHHLYTQA
jgi:hypothetical protein